MKAKVFDRFACGLIFLFGIASSSIAGTGVSDPLKDETGMLIMTTSDNASFASREYFKHHKINHSGVDLSLSKDGTRQDTPNGTVHAICDGEVDFIHNRGGVNSFMKVHHSNCDGRDVIAYYGHIIPTVNIGPVIEGVPIATIIEWKPNNSHLHLTIDTQIERNLSRLNHVSCNYTLDSSAQTVTSLSNCRSSTRNLRDLSKDEMLLTMGWGQIKTVGHTDVNGRLHRENLYISAYAMRQLGFISFFDGKRSPAREP